ncbi:MAG: biopolymer transporter ExbD [candidate division KSB1 bacterium]|nr:biopolymer transporter ExbD [candidate division KSB1 bacterium]MDZ7335663.1 biopolymer transporter ExbD [candidate division KSB1 bacterium]MDZ7357718.1 biopolymer transporter ExbD [candidate division KSB1 bacterium]MDZ7375224.1 biopolymer transporter ExbD [candidate division KSB1 bacterium]MDZ7402040.1 biopolymer transporter ExbD [candidate division KSB1 bacterium]
MAFRPSFRRSVEPEDIELNMTPVMNLMVCMIPLLLSTAQLIKIGVIDLNLPPAVGTSVSQLEAPKEVQKKLDLAITITNQGFYISSSLAILKSTDGQGPTVPLKPDGQYDFETLSRKLFEIKKQALGSFSDTENIIIQAEPDIQYQLLVDTMDAARSIKIEDRNYTLFPEVSLASGVI